MLNWITNYIKHEDKRWYIIPILEKKKKKKNGGIDIFFLDVTLRSIN